MKSYRIQMFASRKTAVLGVPDKVRVNDPVWPHVEQWIHAAYESGGGVSFDLEREIEAGRLARCSMRCNPGRFLLMASIYGDKRDRTICRQDPEGTPERGMIDVGGDDWDARWVHTDLSIALRVFKEVFNTGELSAESLQHMR